MRISDWSSDVCSSDLTDLSYFTADPAAGRDAVRLFNFITGYVEPTASELLAISPISLRSRLYECISAEIANATAGKPAAIWAKMNRSENRRGGKGGGRTCRSWWSPVH